MNQPAFAQQIRRRTEKLSHDMIVFPKKLIINIHELALAHRSGGLFSRHIRWTLGQIQFAYSHGNGPGGYQNHLMPGVFQVAQYLTQLFHPLDV